MTLPALINFNAFDNQTQLFSFCLIKIRFIPASAKVIAQTHHEHSPAVIASGKLKTRSSPGIIGLGKCVSVFKMIVA